MAVSRQPSFALLTPQPSLPTTYTDSIPFYLQSTDCRLTPQSSLLPQFSVASVDAPLLQTAESRLAQGHHVDIKTVKQTEGLNSNNSRQNSSSEALCSNRTASGCGMATCRICFEQDSISCPQDPNNPLISPCQCAGSSKYVHRECLKQWREKKHRSDAYYQCEVCKYRYKYQRLWWSHLLGHQHTLAALFFVTIVACVALLGFIPVTNSFLVTQASRGNMSRMRNFDGGSSSSRNAGSHVTIHMHHGRGGHVSSSSSGVMMQHTGSRSMAAAARLDYVIVHTINGMVVIAVMGLMLGLTVKLGRAFGLPALALLPDPWSSTGAYIWCLDLYGNGCDPLIECGGATGTGECGIALLIILSISALLLGFVLAAYMLYGLLWVCVQAGLNKAQHLVENVQRDSKECSNQKPQ